MSILRCTELLLSKYVTRRRTQICSDRRAAIAALAKCTTRSSLVWENIPMPRKLSGSIKVTVVWTEGHHRIPGNEKADKLPRKGLTESLLTKLLAFPLLWLKT